MKKFIVACLTLGSIAVVACTHTTATVQAPPKVEVPCTPITGVNIGNQHTAFFYSCFNAAKQYISMEDAAFVCACGASTYVKNIMVLNLSCMENIVSQKPDVLLSKNDIEVCKEKLRIFNGN